MAGTRRRVVRHRRVGQAGTAPPPLPSSMGATAATDDPHPFKEMTWGLGGSQCMLCFGYVDDYRHYAPAWWNELEETSIARYEDSKWTPPLNSEKSSSLEDLATARPSV